MAKKEKKVKPTPKPRVHQDLSGFEVSINEFGEIRGNMNIEKINEFLNKNVDDKKLQEREDIEEIKKKGRPKKKDS
ncbi:MAG TPA: hypothetical protein VK508_11935 [Cyclobacteriaceae bacterium]|nr:hypothetical protein [Cyclobacteriaceae bacterium]